MTFWSAEKLEVKQGASGIIDPYNPDRIKYGAYELSLGKEAFETSQDAKITLKPEVQLVIPPGQFALLITEETLKMPADTVGFISMKFGIKSRGLINISGFHVDPGFCGRLKFSVYNAGGQNIRLSCGDPLFVIWFSELDRITERPYAGDHKNQNFITAEDVMRIQGKLASPAVLDERLTKLEHTMEWVKSLAISLVAALVAGILLLGVRFLWNWDSPPCDNTPLCSAGAGARY